MISWMIDHSDGIIGAGCILPLSQSAVADHSLGTRYRAALDVSEESDALILVVFQQSASVLRRRARGHSVKRLVGAVRRRSD